MRNKVLCNNGTYSITTGAEAPCSSAGGVKQQSFDWAEVSKNILKIQGFPDTSNVTSTPVLCKDGTTKIQKESPNAEYMDACVNNGGRAVNQPISVKQQNLKVGDVLTAEDKFYEKLGIKYHNTHMFGVYSRMKGRFYLAVVLVAGYFAYKKFKK
jgi:hypothetical protein